MTYFQIRYISFKGNITLKEREKIKREKSIPEELKNQKKENLKK